MDKTVSESFPRQLRITRSSDFQQVFKSNIRRSDDSLTILTGKKVGQIPRLGFAIARKQVSSAVARNRLKRLFRESFRKHRHCLPPRDIVIMVRYEINAKRPSQIRSVLEQHWNSIIKSNA